MSNPLASAEARQAAEKEIWIVEWTSKGDDDNWLPVTHEAVHYSLDSAKERLTEANYHNGNWHENRITKYALAESYADLVRANVQLQVEFEGAKRAEITWAGLVSKEHSRAQAAESLNRELVAQLKELAEKCSNIIYSEFSVGDGKIATGEAAEAYKLCEAAIQSATPKQGEGNNEGNDGR